MSVTFHLLVAYQGISPHVCEELNSRWLLQVTNLCEKMLVSRNEGMTETIFCFQQCASTAILKRKCAIMIVTL